MVESLGPIEVNVQVNEALGGGAPAGAGGGALAGGAIATGAQSKPFFMAPAAGLLKVLGPLAALLGMGIGITAMLKESKIMSSYLGALKSVFGAMIDMLLAPFAPFFDDILQASLKLSEWLGGHLVPWLENTLFPWLTTNVGPVLASIQAGIEYLRPPGGKSWGEQLRQGITEAPGKTMAALAGVPYISGYKEPMFTVQPIVDWFNEVIMRKPTSQITVGSINITTSESREELERSFFGWEFSP